MMNLVCELNLVCRHKSGVQLFLQVKKKTLISIYVQVERHN